MKNTLIILSLFVLKVGFSQTQEADTCWIDIPKNVTEVCDVSYGKSYDFYTKTNCPVDSFNILIFNRWGEILFENQDIDHYWNALDQKSGTYTWKIKIVFASGRRNEAFGHFNVIK